MPRLFSLASFLPFLVTPFLSFTRVTLSAFHFRQRQSLGFAAPLLCPGESLLLMESWGRLWPWEAKFNQPGSSQLPASWARFIWVMFWSLFPSFFFGFSLGYHHSVRYSQAVWQCSISSSSKFQPLKRWSPVLWSFIWESTPSINDKFWPRIWVSVYNAVWTLPKVLSSKNRNSRSQKRRDLRQHRL